MTDTLNRILQTMGGWNWAEIIKGIVSIWMAIVATIALKTWKRQSKAQKQTDFLDEITNSVYEFTIAMSAPTEMLKYIKIGIGSYYLAPGLTHAIENAEAVTYIQKNGEEKSKKLLEYLNLCSPSLTKVLSLSVKGQVLGLKNYAECQNACKMLTWQYKRIQAFCHIIGSPSLNWENPEVQKTLSKVIQLDHEDIKNDFEKYNVMFLTFVKENYRNVFK